MGYTNLTEVDYKNIWDWVYSALSFKPSTRSTDWPSVQTEKLYCKFSIDFLWKNGYDETLYVNFVNNAINTFIDITAPGETIYALDWQHDCFYYDPKELTSDLMLHNESSIPVISFIPDGDYYIFITKDRQNVWFGHPWEKSVTLIGESLILAAAKNGLPIN
jgi:uncharacterized protein DUF2716